jgi:hypothetical protein
MSVTSYNSDLASNFELLDAITSAFSCTPVQSTFAYQMLKSMHMRCRNRFKITAGLHQNGMQDPLHFSVTVDIADGWCNYLHFNGYYKSGFNVQNISISTVDRDTKMNIVEIIAVF